MTIDCIFQRSGIFHSMSMWWCVVIATPPHCCQPHPVTLNTIKSSFPILFRYKNANVFFFLPNFFATFKEKQEKLFWMSVLQPYIVVFMDFWRFELGSTRDNVKSYLAFFIWENKSKFGTLSHMVYNFIYIC